MSGRAIRLLSARRVSRTDPPLQGNRVMGSGMALSFGCWLVQDLEQIFMTLEGIRKRPTGVECNRDYCVN
jgi:hypothetical protein